MGNGGSASTATHFACDLAKSTIVPARRRLKTMALVGNIPPVSAWSNDSGLGRLLAGLSAHGGSGAGDAGPWAQNLSRAVGLAQERGARVIVFSGFDGGALKEMADLCLVIPVDEAHLA